MDADKTDPGQSEDVVRVEVTSMVSSSGYFELTDISLHFLVVTALFLVVVILGLINLWVQRLKEDQRHSAHVGQDSGSRVPRQNWYKQLANKANSSITRKTTLKMQVKTANFVWQQHTENRKLQNQTKDVDIIPIDRLPILCKNIKWHLDRCTSFYIM